MYVTISSPLVPYSNVFDFFSTQNFALALADDQILGGLYHDSPRAWTISKDKTTLYGTLFRNPSIDPCFFCDYNDNGYLYILLHVKI